MRYQDGQPATGVTVSLGSDTAVTGPDGRFTLATGGRTAAFLGASGAGYLDRETWVIPGEDGLVELNVVAQAPPFSLDFYHRFARGLLDDGELLSLRNWTVQPSFYIQTRLEDVDEDVPEVIVDEIRRVLVAGVPELTGGRLSAAAVELGRESQPRLRQGWIDVVVYRDHPGGPNTLGQASLGGNLGRITLRYNPARDDTPERSARHNCLATIVFVAEHELVHSMGFSHTGSEADFNSVARDCAGTGRSERARFHAALAYSRPRGNRDPDLDPLIRTAAVTGGDPAVPDLEHVACTIEEIGGW